jgi:hypothetical protein
MVHSSPRLRANWTAIVFICLPAPAWCASDSSVPPFTPWVENIGMPWEDAIKPWVADCGEAGWFRIEGSSTCVKLSGLFRTAAWHLSTRQQLILEPDSNNSAPYLTYYYAQLPNNRPTTRMLNEIRASVDTKTPTDFGELATSLGTKTQIELPPSKPGDPNSNFNRTGMRTLLMQAGFKLNGFTVGYMPSFFNLPTASLSYTTAYSSELNTLLAAYTYKMDPISVTLSVEDGRPRQNTDPAWGYYSDFRSTNAFGGLEDFKSPNLVGEIRGDYEWGTVHGALASHPVHASSTFCCGSSGDAMGWAANLGVERWLEIGPMNATLLVAVAAARGGLGYLNLWDYPADFFVSNSGTVYLSQGETALVSYSHNWTKEIRTIVSASAYSSVLNTDIFYLRERGALLQGAFEYTPIKNLTLGVEYNRNYNNVRGVAPGFQGLPLGLGYATGLIYGRYRF